MTAAFVPSPLRLADDRALREAVLAFKEAHPRGRPPLTVQAGVPGRCVAGHVVWPGQRLDHALRTDLAGALLQHTRHLPLRWGWLARGGPMSLHDADAAWSAAWYAACAEAGVLVPFVVVTRHGWRDPRSGLSREWVRLRRHSPVR